jgi:hypothetical protein
MVVSRSVALLVVVLVCVMQLASAQRFQLCTYTDPTTGKSYDLTQLAQQFTTTSAVTNPGHSPYQSPCLALDASLTHKLNG